MLKFVMGFVMGLAISVTSVALADGYLMNWTVTATNKRGQTVTVCESPFVWRSLSLIEC